MLIFTLFTSPALIADSSRDYRPIILTSHKLKLIDGTSWGMNGKKFKKSMKFRLDLNKRRFGEKVANNEVIGFYTFENQKYTLQELIELEERLSRANSTNELLRHATLRSFLKTTLEEFIELSKPFLEDARGAKPEMLALITEWATKTNRLESHLVAWGRSSEGKEAEVIHTQVTSFAGFDQLLSDLVYFLETLMRSCPIATQQFKDLLKKEQDQAQANK